MDELTDLMPFRPCAMMLKVMPSIKLKVQIPNDEMLQKLDEYIAEELQWFDHDLKPGMEMIESDISGKNKGGISFSLASRNEEPAALFELGFTVQQIMLYLEYLKFSYACHLDGNLIAIGISSAKPLVAKQPFRDGYIAAFHPEIKDLLYFQKWGNHPDMFFKDNPKLDSVIRYCRYAPCVWGCGRFHFLMDDEYIHLFVESGGGNPASGDYVNAGIMLFNFSFSARMLNLKGEWKLLREMDKPDERKFKIGENVFHIATWHGQLF